MGMIPLTNYDFQGAVATWGRDQIYPDDFVALAIKEWWLSSLLMALNALFSMRLGH